MVGFLIVLSTILPGIPACADDAVLGGNGKTVFPIKSSGVMFENQGEATELEVGFPEDLELRESWEDRTGIYSFKAWVKKAASRWRTSWESWNIHIGTLIRKNMKKRQRMTVKNQYRGMDGELYTENWSSFEG